MPTLPQDLYYAVGAEQVGRPDANESDRIAWVAIDDALKMIERGEIVGAATVIGVLYARARQHDDS